MRMVPHKSELGKGLKDEPNGLLFAIATLVSVALLLLLFSSARATRAEIIPERAQESGTMPSLEVSGAAYAAERLNGAVEQPNSVARMNSSPESGTRAGSDQGDENALRAAFLHVMASLGGADHR
jgi:hypothetical protein